jgi:hypothetical protein
MSEDVRKKALEKKWRGVLKDFQESSLTVEAYARDRHLSKSTLYKWSKRFSIPLKKPSLSFVELKSLAQVPSSALEVFSVKIRVAKGGCVRVEVPWPKVAEFVKALL